MGFRVSVAICGYWVGFRGRVSRAFPYTGWVGGGLQNRGGHRSPCSPCVCGQAFRGATLLAGWVGGPHGQVCKRAMGLGGEGCPRGSHDQVCKMAT